MKDHDRIKLLNHIETTASRLTTVPRDINAAISHYRQILRARASAGITDGHNETGRAPVGSHSDPTANAATRLTDITDDADETVAQIDRALEVASQNLHWIEVEITKAMRSIVQPPPPQPKRIACVNCARFGLDVDVADGSTRLCANCLTFRRNHRAMPHEAICRAWASGSKRITPGLIAEAKAHARVKRKGRVA